MIINNFIKKLLFTLIRSILYPILADIKRMGYILFLIYDFVVISYLYIYKDTLYNFYKKYLNLNYFKSLTKKLIEFCNDEPIPTRTTILNDLIIQNSSNEVLKNASKKDANELINTIYNIIIHK